MPTAQRTAAVFLAIFDLGSVVGQRGLAPVSRADPTGALGRGESAADVERNGKRDLEDGH